MFSKIKNEKDNSSFPNLEPILNTWLNKKGHSVLHVKTTNQTLVIKQERFLFEKSEKFYDKKLAYKKKRNPKKFIYVFIFFRCIPFAYSIKYLNQTFNEIDSNENDNQSKIIWIRPDEDESILN